MIYEFLTCEIENKVALITINRPPVNPLNSQVFHELGHIVSNLEENKNVRVIVITGYGTKAFVAGADVKEVASKDLVGINLMNKKSRAIFSLIENVSKPVIAAINGVALGGGFELALACDLRIASEHAKFSFPETGLGIIPGGGGTQRLQRIVGQGIAKELIYFGGMIDAKRALELHLVNRVVPQEELIDEALKWATKLTEKPAVALAMAKSSINHGGYVDLESGLTIEMANFATAFASEDAKEGISAFTEKRKPVFVGK